MNSIIVSIAVTAGLMTSGHTLAVDMPVEGKAKCDTCHAIDKSSVAPSFMEISEKYKGDKDAANKIAASITMGGSFGWEFGEMPAKGLGANDAEIQSLSKFIQAVLEAFFIHYLADTGERFVQGFHAFFHRQLKVKKGTAG